MRGDARDTKEASPSPTTIRQINKLWYPARVNINSLCASSQHCIWNKVHRLCFVQ